MIWRALSHPKFFDVLILVLFGCATIRAAIALNGGKVLYFGGAFLLNVAVVFLMEGGK